MSTATRRVSGAGVSRPLHLRLIEREAPMGYILLLPTLLVLGTFLAWPFLFGLWLSVTSAELSDPGHFIGFGNYNFEFKIDHPFWTSFWNTFLYTGVTTVFKFTLGLSMALLLNQIFPLQRFVRAALLLPGSFPPSSPRSPGSGCSTRLSAWSTGLPSTSTW